MKQKLLIFLFLFLLIAVLAGLNAASYVQREKLPDTEDRPNRSTFNTGATGTKAFFDLLSETGHKVVHWQESPAALITQKANAPAVFVIFGPIKREFEGGETEVLFRWVAAGGRLVIVDREPPEDLVTTTANWQISFTPKNTAQIPGVDASDPQQMTRDAAAAKPVQPTVLTAGVTAIQPSRFASHIQYERFAEQEKAKGLTTAPPPPAKTGQFKVNQPNNNAPPPPPPARAASPRSAHGNDDDDDDSYGSGGDIQIPMSQTAIKKEQSVLASTSLTAPLVHFASPTANIVLDAPFGQGRIVYVSDPYIYSNGGIGLVDNVQFAINTVSAGDKLIAFDEYHQGYGVDKNRFLQFFEGTPVVAIFVQAVFLIGFLFFSRSRRFARAVPEPEPDRLSKLEYVSAMAELQQRSRAYDLAIENIYNDFRRRAARKLGVDNLTTGYTDLARLIADRTGDSPRDISSTLYKCEEIIRGEPTNKKEVLDLTSTLRILEQKLGISRAEKVREP